jgi:mono/diheme cytochrome c family protein
VFLGKRMKKTISLSSTALVACLFSIGCDSGSYSKAVQYLVRTDPLVLDKNLGDERPEPDRPGTLPLLVGKDLDEPLNPMFPKRATLFKEGKLRDPTLINAEDRRLIHRVLGDLFGSPASPHVAVSNEIKELLKLHDENLEHGSSLYRVHCLHCHGVTGDGRGPTGRWVNPHPRDYRQGIFKFMSVDQTAGYKRPRRDDLFRVLHQGVEGTAMPSFRLLPASDLEDLVSYVIHLSMRGKVEFDAIVSGFDYDAAQNTLAAKDAAENGPLDQIMENLLALNAKDWVESQGKDKAIPVAPYPYDDKDVNKVKESTVRGYHLFAGIPSDKLGVSKEDAKAANCISCHTSFGRQALYKFDEWGTLTKPRNLTEGVFRGGRRPVDIYYRIHSGISGSGMTSFGKVITNPERIWDLVNFVKTMPYPAMRKSMGIMLD